MKNPNSSWAVGKDICAVVESNAFQRFKIICRETTETGKLEIEIGNQKNVNLSLAMSQ